MTLRLLAAAALALVLAACGGGDDDDGGGGGGGATGGTPEMAAAFGSEFTKIKECVQPEATGGAACTTNFLTHPITLQMCSNVRTGTVNAQFPDADLTKFTATCEDWKTFLTQDAAGRLTTLDKMISAVGAIK